MQGGLLREIKHNVFLNSASDNLAGRQTTHIDSRRSNLPPHTSHHTSLPPHTSLLPHTSLTVETRVYDVQHATSADTHTDIQTNRNTGRQARWRPETVGCDVIRSHAVVGHNTTTHIHRRSRCVLLTASVRATDAVTLIDLLATYIRSTQAGYFE